MKARIHALNGEQAKNQERLKKVQDAQAQLNKEKEKYQPITSQYESLQFLQKECVLLMTLRNQREQLKETGSKASQWGSFVKHYRALREIQIDYSELEAAPKRLENIQKEIQKQNKVLDGYNDQISNVEAEKKGLESCVEKLKTYGKLYLESVHEFHGCPLCGNQEITMEDFHLHLNLESNEINHELLDLYERQRDAEKCLRVLLEAEETLKGSVNQLDLINRAYGDYIQLIPDLPKQDENKLLAINTALQDAETAQAQHTALYEEIQTLDTKLRSNVPDTLLLVYDADDYEEYISSLERSIEVTDAEQTSLIDRVSALIAIIRENESKWNSQTPLLENRMSKWEAQVQETDKQINRLREKKLNIETQVSPIKEYQNSLDQINCFFENVSSLLRNDVEEMDARALSEQCASLILLMDSFLKQEKNKPQIEALEKEEKDLTKKIDRAQNAVDELSKLKESRQYAKNFIAHHINRISEIFCTLHMPREFDRLELRDNQIIGMRDENTVQIKQMSTGQKTAVALSVFLTLHLAMKTAPQFILIDEPVANIDDLNVLSLLDFLRELVILHGKQVFFTTANYNIRKLFRRKFSFLENELAEYCFERTTKLKTSITIQRYNQQKMTQKEVISFVE